MSRKHYYGELEQKRERPSLKQFTGMDGWDIFKGGAGILAGGTASVVAHRYLINAIPKGSKPLENVVIAVGVYFVTGFVGHKVEEYVVAEIETLRTAMRQASDISNSQEGGADAGNR